MGKGRTYFKLLRVGHYVKNLFVFAPLFFVFQFDLKTFSNVSVAFLCFCAMASSVYIINDLFDKKSDQLHPLKKKRPIASGKISFKTAISLLIVLIVISIVGSMLVNRYLCYVLITYLIINLFYSYRLKHIPVLDVIIIACGFVLRILAGSYAGEIMASDWILGMTFLLALFLGFSKRRGELLLSEKNNNNNSKSLKLYTYKRLNGMLIILGVLICTCYVLYTISAEVLMRLETSYVFITAFWVIFGIFRYTKLTLSNIKYTDPTTLILRDNPLKMIILMWIITFIIIKYS